MKIKSLLAAVSMVALTAGSASALSIDNLTPTGVVLAEELQLPADNIGNIEFSVVTDSGDYPAGNNFIIDITLPNGVGIDGPVSGSVLVGTTAGVGTGSAVVQSQSGSNIQLFVSIPQNTNIDSIDFSLPVELTNCVVSGNLVVDVATEGGTDVEGGTATEDSPIEPCESGFDASIVTDVVAGANDTVIGLTDYELLKDNAGANPLVTTSTIGLFSAAIDPSVSVNLAGDPLTPANIDEVTFDVVFSNGEEVEDVIMAGAVVSGPSAGGTTYTVSYPFSGDVVDLPIQVEVEGDDAIPSQTAEANDVVNDLTDTAGVDLIGSEDQLDAMGQPLVVDLDDLQREGQSFGFFDWNSGPAGSQTVSVYRVTGLTAGETVPFTATLENSGADGTYRGSVTADATGEAILFSPTLSSDTNPLVPALPETLARYDFQINFETGNAVDVDRLLSKGGIVTSFGDVANWTFQGSPDQPNGDSDNGFNGSE